MSKLILVARSGVVSTIGDLTSTQAVELRKKLLLEDEIADWFSRRLNAETLFGCYWRMGFRPDDMPVIDGWRAYAVDPQYHGHEHAAVDRHLYLGSFLSEERDFFGSQLLMTCGACDTRGGLPRSDFALIEIVTDDA